MIDLQSSLESKWEYLASKYQWLKWQVVGVHSQFIWNWCFELSYPAMIFHCMRKHKHNTEEMFQVNYVSTYFQRSYRLQNSYPFLPKKENQHMHSMSNGKIILLLVALDFKLFFK